MGNDGRIVGRSRQWTDAFVLVDSDACFSMLLTAAVLEEDAHFYLLDVPCGSGSCHGRVPMERVQSRRLYYHESIRHHSCCISISVGMGMVAGCSFFTNFGFACAATQSENDGLIPGGVEFIYGN